jgi:hypothetical protein
MASTSWENIVARYRAKYFKIVFNPKFYAGYKCGSNNMDK